MKRKGKATGGDAKRKAIDACHALMSESERVHKEKQPSGKADTEKDVEEQNHRTTKAASSAHKESNTSNTCNEGEEVNPDKRPGQRQTYELYRHLGSGMGNYILVNITSREFEDFGGTLLGKKK